MNKKYAFIGKPCDVTVLKNFQKLNPIIAEMIPITMSFFCAGLPSIDAQKKLLEEMGCNSRVISLRYRGNGWPGYATANLENGKTQISKAQLHLFCELCNIPVANIFLPYKFSE